MPGDGETFLCPCGNEYETETEFDYCLALHETDHIVGSPDDLVPVPRGLLRALFASHPDRDDFIVPIIEAVEAPALPASSAPAPPVPCGCPPDECWIGVGLTRIEAGCRAGRAGEPIGHIPAPAPPVGAEERCTKKWADHDPGYAANGDYICRRCGADLPAPSPAPEPPRTKGER